MNLRAPPVFRSDELPETEPKLLGSLTSGFRALYDAMTRLPEPALSAGTFTSAASGVTTVSLKNQLSTKPQHISVSVRREDFSDFSAAWSWWHKVEGGQILLKFIGLPASTRHVYSVEMR